VEFSERAELRREPLTGTIGKRRPHFQPPGAWSDDSSPALCLAESVCHGFDLRDMADRFAALWCLLRHDSSRSTVLAAVNLGDDTDTTGAVAGIVCGFEAIPEAWRKQLARKDEIVEPAQRFDASLTARDESRRSGVPGMSPGDLIPLQRRRCQSGVPDP
jgi:ADP-ribosylglycohydrolase